MAGMTKDQREYALKRLASVFATAEAAVKDKYTIPAVVVDNQERLRMVLSGEATLNLEYIRQQGLDSYYAYKLFDYPVHARAATTDLLAVARDLAPLKAEYTRLQDELMLGDAAKALSMIQEFEVFIQKEGKPWPSR